jgi:hypothetical protein
VPSQHPAEAPDPLDVTLIAAIERLPDAHREQLRTVAIVVANEASAEDLAST